MISISTKIIDEKIFNQYGTFYDLNLDGTDGDVIRSSGDGYTDVFTKKPLIDRPGNLGMTCASALPYIVKEMERHLHTQEAMMCAGEAIAFLVAPAGGESPKASHVRAFILNPGQVVVVNRGVWHSPAFGVKGPTPYYWTAEAYEEDPTVWMAIEGGPIQLVGL